MNIDADGEHSAVYEGGRLLWYGRLLDGVVSSLHSVRTERAHRTVESLLMGGTWSLSLRARRGLVPDACLVRPALLESAAGAKGGCTLARGAECLLRVREVD